MKKNQLPQRCRSDGDAGQGPTSADHAPQRSAHSHRKGASSRRPSFAASSASHFPRRRIVTPVATARGMTDRAVLQHLYRSVPMHPGAPPARRTAHPDLYSNQRISLGSGQRGGAVGSAASSLKPSRFCSPGLSLICGYRASTSVSPGLENMFGAPWPVAYLFNGQGV